MQFTNVEIAKCYVFAQKMRGNHNPGMIMDRNDREIFRDDFRGKLGEIACYNYIKQNMPNLEIQGAIDFDVTPRGQWDITDLIVNNKYISVKSIRQKSNFLMIETKRYDSSGHYSYDNNDGKPVKVDAYILVRVTVDPDIDSEADTHFMEVSDFIKNRTISAEIMGAVTHDSFWKNKHFAPKGIKCSYSNLAAICKNVDEHDLPDSVTGTEKKTEILQQNNYIMNGNTELGNVKTVL